MVWFTQGVALGYVLVPFQGVHDKTAEIIFICYLVNGDKVNVSPCFAQ